MKVQFSLAVDAKQPTRAHPSDAGNDLYASESVVIAPGATVKVKTGVSIGLQRGTKAIVHDRSSMGSKGLHVFGGVVDADYRGEISVVLHNSNTWLTPSGVFDILNKTCSAYNLIMKKHNIFNEILEELQLRYSKASYQVQKGDKIAQLVVSSVEEVEWVAGDLTKTERSDKGFGSSGK